METTHKPRKKQEGKRERKRGKESAFSACLVHNMPTLSPLLLLLLNATRVK